MANKVMYGLKNVHYAVETEAQDGTITYGTPVPWKGAVSLSLDPEGETSTFYADNVAYYVALANNGYSGDFESAMVPPSFLTDVMGETTTQSGIRLESADAHPKYFALLFELDGDVNAVRYALYHCKMARTNIESATKEEGVEVQTVTGEITATPRPNDSIVKGVCDTTTATAYDDWYTDVQIA